MSRRFDSFLRCSLTSTGTWAQTGGGCAERLPEQLLLGRVGQVLVAAHDVGDAHLEVVDDVGEQEHRRAVAAQQHEVLDRLVGRTSTVAADDVVDDRHAVVGRPEAQHAARSGAEPAVARVPVVAAAGRSPPWPLLDLLGREVAVVGEAALEQTASAAATWAAAKSLWKYGPSKVGSPR